MQVVAVNKKASFLYSLGPQYWEAGLVLLGVEIKALRVHRPSIADAYVAVGKDLKPIIYNLQIPRISSGKYSSDYHPKRPKLLLLHKREIRRMQSKSSEASCTLIPVKLFFNKAGKAKVEVALARGKASYEKRADIKKRDWARHKEKLIKRKI